MKLKDLSLLRKDILLVCVLVLVLVLVLGCVCVCVCVCVCMYVCVGGWVGWVYVSEPPFFSFSKHRSLILMFVLYLCKYIHTLHTLSSSSSSCSGVCIVHTYNLGGGKEGHIKYTS